MQTIIAIERDGLDVRTLTINFNVPNKDFDLVAAVKLAATDYCKTDEGKRVYIYNCSNFNWADFAMSVPNEFCKKYGFEKIDSEVGDIEVNLDEHLVDDCEIDIDNDEE